MEQLTEMKCESCSSKEFRREGDYLVCEYCESRYYSPLPKKTEAPKQQPIIIEKTVVTPAKKKRRLPLIFAIVFAFLFIGTCSAILEDEPFEPKTVHYDAQIGETVDTDKWSATVGSYTETVFLKGSYRDYYSLKAPITVTAKEDCSIERKNFDMPNATFPDDALPETLTLKAGETFEGSLYLEWNYARDNRDNESGLDVAYMRSIENVRYADYNTDHVVITWENSAPPSDSVEANATTVFTKLPKTVVRLKATYKESFLESSRPEAIFTMKNGEGSIPVAVQVNSTLKSQISDLKEGDTVVLRGSLNALQTRMTSTDIIREVVLTDASIVS